MLEGYIELFELCIAMVTALLGLAYPLFIDKINQMSDKYKTRRISEKFKNVFITIEQPKLIRNIRV